MEASRSPILLASIPNHQKDKEEFEFKTQEFGNPKKEFGKYFCILAIANLTLPISGLMIIIIATKEVLTTQFLLAIIAALGCAFLSLRIYEFISKELSLSPKPEERQIRGGS